MFAREVRWNRHRYGAGPIELLGKSTLPTSTTVTRAMNHDYGRTAGLGLTYAGTIVVMGALGYALDAFLGSMPWLMIAGIALGAVGGFISLLKKVPGGRSRPPQNGPPSTP